MHRREQYSQHIGVLLLTGAGLLLFVFCTPDSGKLHGSWFLPVALNADWHRLGEPAAAWCSFKIILASAALYLIIEAVATLLARLKHTRLALLSFSLQAVALTGILAGGYYFCKALL
jgi:hypothetical protein